ncbi:hypothetical protein ES705_33891 [subsurface metagenome]
MPVKIAAGHHTIADWDFWHGAAGRSLSSDHFISAPTSLKLVYSAGAETNVVLCRIPATLVLPQGEVRHYFRPSSYAQVSFTFRNQAALGSADWLNCYFVFITATSWQVRRITNGYPFTVGTSGTTSHIDVWNHFRLFWYNGKTPAEQPALCIDLYKDIAGEWVKQGSTIYDTTNKWADSAINRCGFWLTMGGGDIAYIDDTEIWGPV